MPVESARLLIKSSPKWASAVGHDSTASIMSTLLGIEVSVNRLQVQPEVSDKLLCFKLKKRAPEGVILTESEIKHIGYEWVLMTYHGTVGAAIDNAFKEQNDYIMAVRMHSH